MFSAKIKPFKGTKQVIELTAGTYTAVIAPFLGSNIMEMHEQSHKIDFFRHDESRSIEEIMENPVTYGFPTLLYPNRLAGGIMKCSDYSYTFPINDVEGNNHLHGFLHTREHEIVAAEETADAAIARTAYTYDEKDPFFSTFPVSFRAEYTFRLTDNGMFYSFTLTNLSDRQLPFGVCNHTAFNGPFVEGAKPLDARLYVTIGEKWPLVPVKNIPTLETAGLDNHDRQYLTGSMIPVEHNIDNDVYAAETATIDGKPFRGAILSDIASGTEVRYEVDENFRFWVIWNDHGDKGYFCPEPSTWMINAPNLPLPASESGYEELAPGETKTVSEHIYAVMR